MGFLKKVFGGIKKHVKKITKGIMKAMKPMGKVIGKVMKPFGKIMNKLGPVGSMALMFILPMALPAIWGSFGTAVSSMTGPLGSLLKGVHAVGSAAGNVYSTVTGAITDTIGKIAGNTIGKIPLGAERTVGSTYNDFSAWASRKMTGRNLKMTGNIQDGVVDNINEMGAKNTFEFDSMKAANATVNTPVDMSALTNQPINVTPNISSTSNVIDNLGNVVDTSFANPAANTNYNSLLADSTVNTQKVFSNMTTEKVLVNEKAYLDSLKLAGGKPIDKQFVTRVTNNYIDVPIKDINQAMKYSTQQAVELENVVNNYADLGMSNKGINQGATALKQAGKEIGVLQAAQEIASPTPEPVPVAYSKGLASDALALARANDVTTIDAAPMDFAGLSSSYATAGYGAFANPQEQYQAGAYGGGAFNNQVALRMLAPTVALPKI